MHNTNYVELNIEDKLRIQMWMLLRSAGCRSNIAGYALLRKFGLSTKCTERNGRGSLCSERYKGFRHTGPSCPLGAVAVDGGRGHPRSHKLSFSLATEWGSARTALPPNLYHGFSLQIHSCFCCIGSFLAGT